MKVLVVDDCAIFRSLFEYCLKRTEGVVQRNFAANGQQALNLVQNTFYDLIILDLEMPVMDGFEAIPAIKKISPQSKIIVCSGLTRFDFETIQKVLELGADGVTSKIFQQGLSHQLSLENFREELVPRIYSIFQKKSKETLKETLEHTYAKNVIDGVLIIHVLEKNRAYFTHQSGSPLRGILNIKEIIEVAERSGTPICFDNGYDATNQSPFPLVEELRSTFQAYPQELRREFNQEAFGQSLDWVHRAMASFIEEFKIKNLLVMGFNRTCCIKNAVKQLQKYYDLNIFTCQDFIFGHNEENFNFTDVESPSQLEQTSEVSDINRGLVEDYLNRNASIKLKRRKKAS